VTKPEDKIGKNLIGKLEGPEILPDAKRPDKLGEAPMWADLVKAGKLPPVQERVSQDPLVLKPTHEVGKYGGTWRTVFTGVADQENGNRIVSTDKLVFWNYAGTEQRPCLAKSWTTSDGGRVWTFSLREGHKWSDGSPLTTDDVMFWYEDMNLNKELNPTQSNEWLTNGKPGKVEKVDQTTYRYVFPDPYPLLLDVLGDSSILGSSQAHGVDTGIRGPVHPAAYLKQFHPKYTDPAKLDQMAKDAKMDSWVKLFLSKANWALNPELPTLGPWKTTTPINNPTWVLERNPYYFAIDTAGNQLPYWDKVVFTLAENLEVANLRAIAGEFDNQNRHMDLAKLPVFLENQQKGNYTVHLDLAGGGSDAAIQVNQSWQGDPEIQKWLRNRDFRHGMSLGIDRDQLNEVFWLGLGTPGSPVPAEESTYNPGPEWRTKWHVFDPKQANELLDKAGLTQKDSEGMRLRSDGQGRLRFELVTISGTFVPYAQMGEMIAQQLKKVGLQLDVVELERNLGQNQRAYGNDTQLFMVMNQGSEMLYSYPNQTVPVAFNAPMSPGFSIWYNSGGDKGVDPSFDPQMVKALDLFTKGKNELDAAKRIEIGKEIWRIVTEETYTIGLVGRSPASNGTRIVKNNVGNVPARQALGQHVRTPGISHPATMFFKS
jgi:peptide/nickel transport system substrate-binding protein